MKFPSPSARRSEQGVAVVVVLALLSILMLYLAANLRSLHIMHQEIKLVEQHQLRHWSSRARVAPASGSPTVPVAGQITSPSNSPAAIAPSQP